MRRKKETSLKRKIKVGATGGMMPDSRGFLVLSNLLMLLSSPLAHRILHKAPQNARMIPRLLIHIYNTFAYPELF